MGIEQICQSIMGYFEKIRPPFPQLSRILLVCSMVRRPGLSTIHSVSNIVKDLNKLGIPTGPMPDGSANLTVAFTFANTKEIYRGIKKDMSIQASIVPGSAMVFGTGANSGGPVIINGTITNAPIVVGGGF